MLKSLTVWNFALLEHVEIAFGAGLNILTGETGAGKSILIDALGAVLGRRVSASAIRTGCDWLRVEAVFDVTGQDALRSYLSEQAVDSDDGTLILTRQVARTGRSNVLVNGCHITLAVLKAIGAYLVDVHGQNENLALLKEANQYALVDGESPETAAALASYRKAYAAFQEKQAALAARQHDAREVAQRLDMLRWQAQEIEDAKLESGEDEQHEDEKMVDEAEISLQEAAYEIRDYGDAMDFSPQKLNALQSRMDAIDKLRKKYGATVADILEHLADVQKELEAIENYDDDVAALKQEIAEAGQALAAAAKTLTATRTQSAARLTKAIGAQLAALGMKKAQFTVELVPLASDATGSEKTVVPDAAEGSSSCGSRGAERIRMMFSANPGEAAKPLESVASGGELSRIALAIKAVSAARDDAVPSMVFDEIDTGLGGRTAQMVAERIALVACYKQVLCITHLPQIACMADVHLYILKHSEAGHTVTDVRRLTDAQRVNEIARMASGSDVTAASLDNAREMLARARQRKAAAKR